MPRLRILAGPSPSSLTPITSLVNTSGSHTIQSDAFEGQVSVNIKGLVDEDGTVRDGDYFSREDRQGITWSIQVQGRFLTPHTADDILFGNTFDRPLKLPWGSGAALKFMKFIDPVLDHDLTSPTKPWALSPLIATMPHFVHHRPLDAPPHGDTALRLPAFPPAQSIGDDVSQLHLAVRSSADCSSADYDGPSSHLSHSPISSRTSLSPRSSRASSMSSSSSNSSSLSLSSTSSKLSASSKGKSIISSLSSRSKKEKKLVSSLNFAEDAYANALAQMKTSSERRSYFSNAANRQAIVFGPKDLITTDFCYGFLQFSPSLALSLPGGLSFDLMRYWDGQPVRFVCCERKKQSVEDSSDSEDGSAGVDGDQENGCEDPWGRVFWCVVIELAD